MSWTHRDDRGFKVSLIEYSSYFIAPLFEFIIEGPADHFVHKSIYNKSQWVGLRNLFGPMRGFNVTHFWFSVLCHQQKVLIADGDLAAAEEDGRDDDDPGVIKTAPDSSSTASAFLSRWMIAPRVRVLVTRSLNSVVTCHGFKPHFSSCSGLARPAIRITLVTRRSLNIKIVNMDITISLLLLIWPTLKWLSAGPFILLAAHTQPSLSSLIWPTLSVLVHVWRCQWSEDVNADSPWPGPGTSTFLLSCRIAEWCRH